MPALPHLAATRTATGLDVELRDDGCDRRQIGLILNHGVEVVERHMALGTFIARHVDDAIHLVGSGRWPQCGRMSLGPPRALGFGFAFLTAKRRGLAML